MEKVLELFQSVADLGSQTYLIEYLESCIDLGLFGGKGEDVQQIISKINSLLNDNVHREKGLEILKTVLPQFCLEDVMLNISSWMQQCLKVLSTSKDDDICEIGFETFGLLLSLSVEFPDIKKTTSLGVIPQFLEVVNHGCKTLSESSSVLLRMLQCLEICLKNYGKSCASIKGYLESFLISRIESCNPIIVICGNCFIQLCQVGPSSTNNENYKKSWHEQQKYLVGCMHLVLDQLFDNVNEIESSYPRITVKPDLPKIPEVSEPSPLMKIQRLTNQFMGLAEYLKSMLLRSFPIGKLVIPEAILSILCRALAVTCTTLEARPSFESLSLATQIPKLHITCFTILSSLIKSCRMNLIPHSLLICKLVAQSLKWTNKMEHLYGQEKPYSSLRVAAYNCLTDWLITARGASFVENIIVDLKTAITSDIQYNKPIIKLNVQGMRKGKSKLKKRNITPEPDKNLHKSSVINKLTNKTLCSAALKALAQVVEAASVLIKPKIHQEFQEEVIRQILLVQSQSDDLPLPYCNEDCRIYLYLSLLSLTNNFHPQFPPPVQYANVFFTKGLQDKSLKVVQICSMASSCVDKILRPVFPSLDFPVDISMDISPVNPLPQKRASEHINKLKRLNRTEIKEFRKENCENDSAQKELLESKSKKHSNDKEDDDQRLHFSNNDISGVEVVNKQGEKFNVNVEEKQECGVTFGEISSEKAGKFNKILDSSPVGLTIPQEAFSSNSFQNIDDKLEGESIVPKKRQKFENNLVQTNSAEIEGESSNDILDEEEKNMLDSFVDIVVE